MSYNEKEKKIKRKNEREGEGEGRKEKGEINEGERMRKIRHERETWKVRSEKGEKKIETEIEMEIDR